MDKKEYKMIIYCILLVFLNLCGTAIADEFEKPTLQLPEVTIFGVDESKTAAEKEAGISPDTGEKVKGDISSREEEPSMTTKITGGYGAFKTGYLDVIHSARFKNFGYSSTLGIKPTSWDRANSDEIAYRSSLNASFSMDEVWNLSIGSNFFSKDMELPGPVNSPFPDAERRNDDLKFFIASDKNLSRDERLHFKGYFDGSRVEENAERPDYSNRFYGIDTSYQTGGMDFVLNISRNELLTNYDLTLTSFHVQDDIEWTDRIKSTLSGGLDYQEGFGVRLNPIVGISWNMDERTTYKASVQRTFSPHLFDKLYLEDNYAEINPDVLNPERSWDIEVGVDHWFRPDRLRGSLTLFRKDSKDFIIWDDSDDNDGLYKPINLHKAYFEGIKAGFECYWNEYISEYINYSFTDIHNKDSSANAVTYYPNDHVEMGWTIKDNKGLRMDITGEYVGEQFSDKITKDTIPDYFLMNSRLSYEIKDYLTLFVIIDNLLNEDYELREGYPALGRNVMGGAKIEF